MSQEKVNRNKELKANRKKINRKKKIYNTLVSIATGLVCLAIVVFIVFSIYKKQTTNDDGSASKVPVNLTAITGFISDLSSNDSE